MCQWPCRSDLFPQSCSPLLHTSDEHTTQYLVFIQLLPGGEQGEGCKFHVSSLITRLQYLLTHSHCRWAFEEKGWKTLFRRGWSLLVGSLDFVFLQVVHILWLLHWGFTSCPGHNFSGTVCRCPAVERRSQFSWLCFQQWRHSTTGTSLLIKQPD